MTIEQSLIERLEARVATLEQLMQNIDGGVEICQCNEEFTIQYVNQGFTRLTGYTLEAVTQQWQGSHRGLVYPPDRDRVMAEMLHQLNDTGHCELEYRIQRADGSIIWVLERSSLFLSGGQRLNQSILTDITKQKKTEQELRLSEQRHALALDFSDVTVFDYDIRTQQMRLPRADAEEFNLPRVIDNAVETLIQDVIHPRSHDAMRELYRKINDGAPSATATVYATNELGEEHIIQLSLVTVYDDDGQPVNAVGIRRDITEKMRLERELEYGSSLVANKQFVYEADLTTDEVLWIDPQWQAVLHLQAGASYTDMVDLVCSSDIDPVDLEAMRQGLSVEGIQTSYGAGQRLIVLECRHLGQKRDFEWFELTLNIIQTRPSGDIVVRAYLANISQKKEEQLRLLYRSQYDLLTGVLNKSTMGEQVDRLLELNRNATYVHAFLLIDLDRFKEINDNFGHAFGDEVLTRFAAKLRALCRADDLLGRIGGDEFALVMPNLRNAQAAIAKAQDICTKMVEVYQKNGVEYRLSVSVGISFYPSQGEAYAALYDNADKALYESKRAGRSRSTVYQPEVTLTGRLPPPEPDAL